MSPNVTPPADNRGEFRFDTPPEERKARSDAAKLQRWLEQDSARSNQLKLTVVAIRQHPDFPGWQAAYPSGDTAHDMIVKQWQGAVVKANGHRYPKHPHRFFPELTDAAQEFMEAEQQALAAVYGCWLACDERKAAPRSVRDLYDVVHAIARTPGTYGGPNVIMSHSVAIALIRARTGRRYSKGTITNAREWLTRRAILSAEVGIPWSAEDYQGQTISTLYKPLPTRLIELALCARVGLVQFGGDNRPPMLSPDERQLLDSVRGRRRMAKLEASEKANANRSGVQPS